eukprot:TRINITY_DN5531_c0_g1_i1.p1 TRINITY_DN5531_c0_g1~~TRINITY_DN5531_c0_g1_i1.p1  ORF type:complete len:829 (-),score=238.19 TRINITY_DN5531_c0_g1_i1:264-2750(-)
MAPPKTVRLRGQWKGKSAGGCLNHPGACRFNPQLFITVDQPTPVSISLSQEDDFNIGIYILKAESTNRRQILLDKNKIVSKAAFMARAEVVVETTLQEGSYVVIPCTFNAGEEGKFTICFTVENNPKISPLPPTGEWKCVTAKGIWKGKTAGGCRSHSTCPNNPQFLIRTRKATKAIIAVERSDDDLGDAFGVYVVKTKASTHKLRKLKSDNVIGKSSFVKSKEATLELSLEPKSKYAVIPATYKPGTEGSCSMTIFSTHDLKLRTLKDPSEITIEGEWSGSGAGGCLDHATWRLNGQYLLLLDQRALLQITLEPISSDAPPIGFYVAKNPDSKARVLLSPEEIVAESDFMPCTVGTTILLEGSPNPYVIIPCTQQPGCVLPFKLTASVMPSKDPDAAKPSRGNKLMQLLPCSDGWRRKIIQGRWVSPFTGGCMQEGETWVLNPHFCLSVSAKCRIVLVLWKVDPKAPACLHTFQFQGRPAPVPAPPSDMSIVRTSEITTGKETILEVDVEGEASYHVFPCLQEAGCEGGFALDVFCNEDVEFSFVPVGSNQKFVKPKERHTTSGEVVTWDELNIGEKIGRGGFGVVYKGFWKGKPVAVKKVHSDEMDDGELASFRSEVELMRELSHENVLTCLGASLDTELFIITEFMGKGNMSECLQNEPNLPWSLKIQMAIDAAMGMLHLHSRETPIVHRDLKSLNLLVDEQYRVKVADFGLSKATSGKSLNSKVGSLNWAAPEILLRRAAYTPQSDVYSFGMVLYELVTEHPPFQNMNPLQVVRAIDSGELPQLPDGTNEEYVSLVEDCWRDEPLDRPGFAEIVERLQEIHAKC